MAQNIRHLAASQRRYYRVTAPLRIVVKGEAYITANWNFAGFRIDGLSGKVNAGEVLDVKVYVPFQGFNIDFPAQAVVVRYDPSGHTIGAEFQNMDMRSQKLLKTFIDGIVSGEMESVEGIIRRLDVPVTPISLMQKNSVLPLKDEELTRRKGMYFYAIAGIALAIALAASVYTSFFQLKIDSAMVMGKNDIINAPVSGIVTYAADVNKDVPAGSPIISFTDPKLDYDITLANLKVEDATVELNRLEAMLQTEKKRLVSAGGIVSKQWEAASRQVNSLQKDLKAKGGILEKNRSLLEKGLETNVIFQQAQTDYMETKRQLNQAKLVLATLEQQLAAVKGGFQVRDQFVQPGTQDIEALATAAHEKMEIAKSEREFLAREKNGLTIKAPADGHLIRVFTPMNGTTKIGEPVAVFERDGKRMIQAYLTQKEALNIVKGQEGRAYTHSNWWGSMKMRVADIDYHSLTLRQTQGYFQGRDFINGDYKSVIVMLEPVDGNNKEIDKIAPGTAATVVF
jgi:multidrug resistance efflux pump